MLYASPFWRIRERRRGMNLFEAGPTGTGISSMINILTGQWSISSLYLTFQTSLKTTACAVVSGSNVGHQKNVDKIRSYPNNCLPRSRPRYHRKTTAWAAYFRVRTYRLHKLMFLGDSKLGIKDMFNSKTKAWTYSLRRKINCYASIK